MHPRHWLHLLDNLTGRRRERAAIARRLRIYVSQGRRGIR